jgi:hypothetical protein
LTGNASNEHLLQNWHEEGILTRVKTAQQAHQALLAAHRKAAGADREDESDYDPLVDLPPRRLARYEYRVRRQAVHFP